MLTLLAADGRVLAHENFHGYGTEGSCKSMGRDLAKSGRVRFICQSESTTPVRWYN